MALSPERSENLFIAVYNVIMGYHHDYVDRDEARRMIEMLFRGVAGARLDNSELRDSRPAGDGAGRDQPA